MTSSTLHLLAPVAPEIMRWNDDGSAVLLGGYDASSGTWTFPTEADGGGALNLGGEGRLHAFTTVHVRPPFGLPSPYSVGYVDLNAINLRVFCLVSAGDVAPLRGGARMRLFARPLGLNPSGEPCLRPVFEATPDE